MFRSFVCRLTSLQRSSLSLFSRSSCSNMELPEVVSLLKEFAPLSLAEKWDNVGLLVEPSGKHIVDSILLTIDLTENVMDEACEKNVNLILSYHPPIFTPLKRLTSQNMKERIVIKALENRIAIYSPHTAFDAVNGGVNDWLAVGLGDGKVSPLSYSMAPGPFGDYQINCEVTEEGVDSLIEDLHSVKGVTGTIPSCSAEVSREMSVLPLVVYCSGIQSLAECLSLVKQIQPLGSCETTIKSLEKHPIPGTGQGRLLCLNSPVGLQQMITRVKKHLNLEYVRVACGTPPPESITTIAICAGSGASVLKGMTADLYLTGEMSHHEVIEATSHGVHVILCEHSNSERGFLVGFSKMLSNILKYRVGVHVSEADKDPLSVM